MSSGPVVVEDPALLTKERLKSLLLAHKVVLPAGDQKKNVYVTLYQKHVAPKRSAGVRQRPGLRAEFSSDEEEQTPRASPSRACFATALGLECAKGFYRAEIGHCCMMCRAGSYKQMDCASEGQSAMCEVCPKDYYIDEENNAKNCNNCSHCGEDEDVDVRCSLAQDTKCVCKEGLTRDHTSKACVPDRGNWRVVLLGIVVSVLLLIILAVGFKMRNFLNLHGRLKNPREDATRLIPSNIPKPEEQNTLNLIKNTKTSLIKWIGNNPSPILEYMDTECLVTRHVYKHAMKMQGTECADFLLSKCIEAGEIACQKLLEALLTIPENYPDIEDWLRKHDIKQMLPTFEGRTCTLIRKAKRDLVDWIGVENRPLVAHMMTPRGETMQDFNVTPPSTSELINHVIDNGEPSCLALVSALKDLQAQYPATKNWLKRFHDSSKRASPVQAQIKS